MADPRSSSSSDEEPMEIVEDAPIDNDPQRFPREDVDSRKPSSNVTESTSDNRKSISNSSKEANTKSEIKTSYYVDNSAVDTQTVKDFYLERILPHIVAKEKNEGEAAIAQQGAGRNGQRKARVSSQLSHASDDKISNELSFWQVKDEQADTKTNPLRDPSIMRKIQDKLLNNFGAPRAEDVQMDNKTQPRAPTDIVRAGPSWAQGRESTSSAHANTECSWEYLSRPKTSMRPTFEQEREGTSIASRETSQPREMVARPQRRMESTSGQARAGTTMEEGASLAQSGVPPIWRPTQAETSPQQGTSCSQTINEASTWRHAREWTSSAHALSEMSWNQPGHGTSGFQTNVRSTSSQVREEKSRTQESSETSRENSEEQIMMNALSLSRQEKQPGRHQLGGDLALASQLAYHTPHSRRARVSTRESRFSPYEPTTRNTEGTGKEALRKSRLVRSETTSSAAQTEPFLPLLAYPGYFSADPRPVPNYPFYTSHTQYQMLNHSYTPYTAARQTVPQLYTPHTSVQIRPRSPALLFASQPQQSTSGGFCFRPMDMVPQFTPIIAPHNQPQPSTSRSAFDLPVLSETRPLDLTTTTNQRQLPHLLRMSATSAAGDSQPDPRTARSTPRTHTYTSTASNLVYVPPPLLLEVKNEESNQARIAMYSSCKEHLLNEPHRAKTPTDPLPEHQQYQEWPVKHAASEDQTDDMEVSDSEAWLSMQNVSSVSVAVSQPSSVPITRHQPTMVVTPLTPSKTARPSPPSSPQPERDI